MSVSVRHFASMVGIAIGALGMVALTAPASYANIIRPTSYVWTGSTALANCQTQGQWEVANNGWDGYSCKPDPSVAPDAIQLWVIIAT